MRRLFGHLQMTSLSPKVGLPPHVVGQIIQKAERQGATQK